LQQHHAILSIISREKSTIGDEGGAGAKDKHLSGHLQLGSRVKIQ